MNELAMNIVVVLTGVDVVIVHSCDINTLNIISSFVYYVTVCLRRILIGIPIGTLCMPIPFFSKKSGTESVGQLMKRFNALLFSSITNTRNSSTA
jgi:hypothetical protein